MEDAPRSPDCTSVSPDENINVTYGVACAISDRLAKDGVDLPQSERSRVRKVTLVPPVWKPQTERLNLRRIVEIDPEGRQGGIYLQIQSQIAVPSFNDEFVTAYRFTISLDEPLSARFSSQDHLSASGNFADDPVAVSTAMIQAIRDYRVAPPQAS
jgi:hypothetical protein